MIILALVLARGGSKRLPKKNIKLLGGKPMIVWSIESAKKIRAVCDTLVSTDDQKIADICLDALVPWLRPSHLAVDTASSVDAALHALDWYESNRSQVDGLMLLQPTSPFRSVTTIERGLELFAHTGVTSVIAVSRTTEKSKNSFEIKGAKLSAVARESAAVLRNDIGISYSINGSLYLIEPEMLRKTRSFSNPDTVPLVVCSKKESLDIDTYDDFLMAQSFLDNNGN